MHFALDRLAATSDECRHVCKTVCCARCRVPALSCPGALKLLETNLRTVILGRHAFSFLTMQILIACRFDGLNEQDTDNY